MATLYAFYYMHKKPGVVLLYAYTDDKNLAKEFRAMRNEKRIRMVKKKFEWEDVNEGIFFDSLVKEVYDKRSTRFRTKKLDWHSLTDGVNDYMIPLTYTEVTEITAKVHSIEDTAMQNIASIKASLMHPKIKNMLLTCNKTTTHPKGDECYSAIDTLTIFTELYKKILKF